MSKESLGIGSGILINELTSHATYPYPSLVFLLLDQLLLLAMAFALTFSQAAVISLVSYAVWRLLRPFVLKSPLDNVRGPKPASWWKGTHPRPREVVSTNNIDSDD